MRAIADEAALIAMMDIPFSREQLAAITAPADEPQVIIAGAGSGKTTVMAARVVWLVGHVGLDPASILGLTFTNKAAAELGQRVRIALAQLPSDLRVGDDSDDGEPTVSTYHAFAGTLIAEHGLRLGIEPDLRITSDASRFQRLARVIHTYDQPLEWVTTHVPTLIEQVMSLDGQLSEHLVATERLRTFDQDRIVQMQSAAVVRGGLTNALKDKTIAASRQRLELSHLVDRYRAAKAEAGVMDFSDQMAWGAQLATLSEVGTALRDRFGIVLLDEYQDTSVAQRDLLKNLFAGPGPESGRGHSVTAVGDPAQGIYGWRGAAASNLADFLNDFPRADGSRGVQHSLAVSRRCPEPIIDVANTLAAPYYATSDVVTPLQSAPGNDTGDVTVSLHERVDDEIEHVVDQIVAAHDRQTGADDQPIGWKDIAILVRESKEIGAIVAALRGRDIPVEVVGLNGLLSRPEAQDLFAVLEVVDDVTANPALLRLLTGPRWRIGQRDLALLGSRAAELIRSPRGPAGDAELEAELLRAVEGTDPTEIVSLADALEDPGQLPYSSEALARFEQVAALLRSLRAHTGEPLVDFTRRTIRAIDLDLELQIGPVDNAMDNVEVLLEAIAAYAENDPYASLRGLLAYLAAEDDYNKGMEVSAPSDADSVKLLTAHKAKGLEYECVFVPFMAAKVFPSDRAGGIWFSSCSVLPVPLRGDRGTLPDIAAWSTKGVDDFKAANQEDSRNEERRLGYVAFTRAKKALYVSGHWWGRTQIKARGPSDFLMTAHQWAAGRGLDSSPWTSPPVDGSTNPYLDRFDRITWPAARTDSQHRRDAAQLVRAHLEGDRPAVGEPQGTELEREQLGRLGALTTDIDLLLQEAARAESNTRQVRLPSSLSATTALRLAEDESAVARELARPMPRKPSPSARFGTKFHAWVETHFGQQTLLDPADLPGRGDPDITGNNDLEALTAAFSQGPYGDSQPHAIEAPFALMLGGQQIIGRIDAVYRTSMGFEVVDWKTNKSATADRLQLAIYRLAWAELSGLDPATVTGAFYYVRLGKVVRFDDLPDRRQLIKMLGF